ncbi:transcription factor AP-4 isoform X1 [Thamnophis elegans]|uniref:transcription factor AP-4 isoform X1 n=1 Tax=Thamnophis elegans TaxID=35005 RepID=UPI001377BE22|nr:transcription factor AP-4 isoform X1 [Thamnophis elegans]
MPPAPVVPGQRRGCQLATRTLLGGSSLPFLLFGRERPGLQRCQELRLLCSPDGEVLQMPHHSTCPWCPSSETRHLCGTGGPEIPWKRPCETLHILEHLLGASRLANIPLTPETQRDQERRIRREIANSNERRRMQSINAGFQSLKTLIPHTDGEKLSKAAILQQTAEYIFSLEQEKTRLLQQNAQLKRFIQEFSGSSPKRRRAEDKDEGIGSPDIWEDEKADDLRREMIELRQQLDKERSVRMMLEEQVRSLEAHLYPEKLKVIAQQVQLQQQEQLLPAHGPPAPTQHPTVIVPAPPPPSHHVTVVTMGPSSVINTISTSRQNLDTIVQAIQHIEGTQEKQLLEEEEQRRGAVIVTPARASLDPANLDTASDLEAEDDDSMEHSKAGVP